MKTTFHQIKLDALVAELSTDTEKGLSAGTAAQRLEEYGRNSIRSNRRTSPWMILLHQFKSPVVYLLLIAAGMSLFFEEWLDAIAIGIVILLNAAIGFAMELQAERSMEALQQLAQQTAKVYRNGQLKEIPSDEIVPGDLLFMEAGDMVQADGRIARSTDLQADESALTGESVPVEKSPGDLTEDTTLAERTNMVYKGTFIRNGNAYVICTGTGMQTELGHIAEMVAGAKKSATPLEKKLEGFSKRLIFITIGIVVLIFVAGLLNDKPVLEMLKTSIALAVAAIPEGLPIVATLALARGMIRMARHKVIVKKLSAVETLGATTFICTDKTGTLTENRMDVTAAATSDETADTPETIKELPALELLQQTAILCNNASLEEKIGDPLEVSLLEFATATGADVAQYREKFHKQKEEPFNSDTKVMGTLHKGEGDYVVSAKGAMENLLPFCTQVMKAGKPHPLTEDEKQNWLQQTEKLAASGLKTLAFATRNTNGPVEKLMEDLTLIGITGFMDPPREGVQQVIQECYNAGIRIMMLTGDHPATAANIAQQLGISKSGQDVINGKDMGDNAQTEKWLESAVFARVSPKQKLDLVDALQARHHIVAMTGDGVNDAPALKKADIGIAMGIRGTQVSQEVADMILKDDAFASIVHAIKQGRVIFENIRRFIMFLLSCNLSELLVIGVIATLNLPFQLLALQILFINLITDVLPAMALGFTEDDDSVMQKKPKDPQRPIIEKKHWISIWTCAVVIGGSALAAAFLGSANNILFFTLIFSQLLHGLNMRTAKEGILHNPVLRNPYLWMAIVLSTGITVGAMFVPPVAEALGLYHLPLRDWIVVITFSAGSLLLIQLLKGFRIIA